MRGQRPRQRNNKDTYNKQKNPWQPESVVAFGDNKCQRISGRPGITLSLKASCILHWPAACHHLQTLSLARGMSPSRDSLLGQRHVTIYRLSPWPEACHHLQTLSLSSLTVSSRCVSASPMSLSLDMISLSLISSLRMLDNGSIRSIFIIYCIY